MEGIEKLLGELANSVKQQQNEIASLVKAIGSVNAKIAHNPADGGATSGNSVAKTHSAIQRDLNERIQPFVYAPRDDLTFDRWYERYKDEFSSEDLSESEKRGLVLGKLGDKQYALYADFILPKKPTEATLEHTVSTLKTLFNQPDSVFCARWKCFQVAKRSDEDYSTYAAKVNKLCENFKLKELALVRFMF